MNILVATKSIYITRNVISFNYYNFENGSLIKKYVYNNY